MLLSYQRSKSETGDSEMTCDRPDNPYTVSSTLAQRPNGARLDYVMYRANAGKCFDFQDVPWHYITRTSILTPQ